MVVYAHVNGLVVELMQPKLNLLSLMADYLRTHNNTDGLRHVAFDISGASGGKMGMRERVQMMG